MGTSVGDSESRMPYAVGPMCLRELFDPASEKQHARLIDPLCVPLWLCMLLRSDESRACSLRHDGSLR